MNASFITAEPDICNSQALGTGAILKETRSGLTCSKVIGPLQDCQTLFTIRNHIFIYLLIITLSFFQDLTVHKFMTVIILFFTTPLI